MLSIILALFEKAFSRYKGKFMSRPTSVKPIVKLPFPEEFKKLNKFFMQSPYYQKCGTYNKVEEVKKLQVAFKKYLKELNDKGLIMD